VAEAGLRTKFDLSTDESSFDLLLARELRGINSRLLEHFLTLIT